MVKVPVKRKQKQKQKQKVIQKTKVAQNVKVVIGEVKRKQVRRKASGSKVGASAKPPIVLNISNPQPLNNPYMEYFKQQLQNQEPIKATTLAQNEILNEREENKASKAGALHRLDEEPNDVARRIKAQGEKLKEVMKISKKDDENKMMEMRRSLKPVSERKVSPQPLRPIIPHPKQNLMEEIRQAVPVTPSSEEMQSSVVSNLQQQQEEYKNLMTPNPYDALEEEETRMEFPSEMELATRREMNRRELEGAGAGWGAVEPTAGVGAVEPPKRKGRGPNKTKEQIEAEAQAKKEKAEQREAKRQQKKQQQKSKKDRRK